MVGMVQKSWRLVLALSLLLTLMGAALPLARSAEAANGYDIAGMSNTQQPSLGISPDGSMICAVWSRFDVDPQTFARIYTVASGSWGPVVQLSEGTFNRVQFPHCTIENNGTVHAAWEQGAGTLSVAHSRLVPGQNWTRSEVQFNADMSDIDARQNVTGQVWAVFRQGDGAGGYNVWAKMWNGSGWSDAEFVGGGAKSEKLAVEVDNSGYVHVVYQAGGGAGVRYAFRAPGGGWSSTIMVPGSGGSGTPHLAVNRDTSEAHIVYAKDFRNLSYTRTAPGAAFAPVQLIAVADGPGATYLAPRIAWSPSRLFVVVDDSKEHLDLVTSTNGGASWSGVARLAQPSGGTEYPWVVADRNGNGYVAYAHRSGSTVFFTTADATSQPPPPPAGGEQRFSDVPTTHRYFTAIDYLADRDIIRGYGDGRFGPNDTTLRAQMAAMIARAMGWDAQDWGNPFTDQGFVDNDLWRNVGTLAHYDVARGYTPEGCRRIGVPHPCFGPTDKVLHAQSISFITRAMVAKGFWVHETEDKTALYANVGWDTGHRQDLLTYHKYTGGIPETTPTENWDQWNQPATRGWFAQALYLALQAPR